MIKSYSAPNEVGVPNEDDLALINKYSLRPLTKEEVFVFSVILCDNDIDRDHERFSENSLKNLEKLFIGKTGILNHSMQSEDQSARAYRTQLLTDSTKKTADGREYVYLKAWCYTVRSGKNDSLIRDIESGIKKEVSISCSADKRVCSVCGETHCAHIAGREYGGKICFKTIEDITDAYEWSFVAVPAQKNAGVTKSAGISEKEKTMENILKSIRNEKRVTLEETELKKLCRYIDTLESESEDGKKYRQSLIGKAKKSFALAIPTLDGKCVDDILKSLSSERLEMLCASLEKQVSGVIPTVSQFCTDSENTENDANRQFKF